MAKYQTSIDLSKKLHELSVEVSDLLDIYSTQASALEPSSLAYMSEKEFQNLFKQKAQAVKATTLQWLSNSKATLENDLPGLDFMWATYADIYKTAPKEAKSEMFIEDALKSPVFIFRNLGDIDIYCKLDKKERDNTTLIKAVFHSLDKMISLIPNITQEDSRLTEVAEKVWNKLPDRVKKSENAHNELAFSAYFTRQNPDTKFDDLDKIVSTYNECIDTKNKKPIEAIYSKCSPEVKKALDLAYAEEFSILSKESRSNPENFTRALRKDLNNLKFIPSSVLCKDSNQEIVLPEVVKKFTAPNFNVNQIKHETMDKIIALPAIAYSVQYHLDMKPSEIVQAACDEFPELKKLVDSSYNQILPYKFTKNKNLP